MPRIGIYTGKGASHSWIWFADTFERLHSYDLSFVWDETTPEMLNCLDTFIIGGGDTYAIADAFGRENFDALSRFIHDGGLYIGTCAGAYLPLNSSKEKLSMFNLVEAKINNLARFLEVKNERFTAYGCGMIYHPVRGPLSIRIDGREIIAPLYGGPPMTAYGDVEEIAYYDGFTTKTMFLVDSSLAKKTMIDKAAIVRKEYGEGLLYLCGPHLEHPDYPEANEVIAGMILDHSLNRNEGEFPLTLIKDKEWFINLKEEISNARIISYGLSTRWKIGEKIWEAEKMGYFLDAIWKRLKYLRNIDLAPAGMVDLARNTTRSMRELRMKIVGRFSEGQRSTSVNWQIYDDTTELAERIFDDLRILTSTFLEFYFWCRRMKEI